MTDGCYYREEARRCRVRAAREPDSASSRHWLQLASEYEFLADDLDESPPSAAIDRHVRLQGTQQHHAREDPARTGRRALPDSAGAARQAGKAPATD